jgi:hypothetical protein
MTKSTESGGTHNYTQPDATQAERRELLANARKVRLRLGDREPTTYFEIENSDDDEAGGRYVRRGGGPDPAIMGAVPQWSRDAALVPIEPPTGELIDAVPDLGFPQPPAPEPDDEPTEEATE